LLVSQPGPALHPGLLHTGSSRDSGWSGPSCPLPLDHAGYSPAQQGNFETGIALGDNGYDGFAGHVAAQDQGIGIIKLTGGQEFLSNRSRSREHP